MSSQQHLDVLKDFEEQIAQATDADKREKLIKEKELFIREHRVNIQHEELLSTLDELERAKTVDYSAPSKSEIDRIVKDNNDYMEAAKYPLLFINEDFNGVVPFYRKNIILIGARTGHGKSTTVANIVCTLMVQQKNDGKETKILILVNEEKPEDVYNRITCYMLGWKYVNHHEFTDEQRAIFNRMIPILAKQITVVADDFEGVRGTTTTIEGIQGVFDRILADGVRYDAILIDYYQKVTESKKNPSLDEYKVQRKFANMLDTYKNDLSAPIVLFAQLKNDSEEPFNIRIGGTKRVCDVATLTMEMKPDYENYRTQWIVHKSRFTSAMAERSDFYTGFEGGRFVPYDGEFLQKVSDRKHEKMIRNLDKKSGEDLKNKMEKKDGNNSETGGSEQA